jgi:predicted transcriptional regulator
VVKRRRVEIGEDISLFSPLEKRIMEYLWENPGSGVSEISNEIKAPLSSVAVTVDRLSESGYLEKKKERKGDRMRFVYYPTVSKTEAERKALEKILDALMEKFGDLVVDYFQRRSENGRR